MSDYVIQFVQLPAQRANAHAPVAAVQGLGGPEADLERRDRKTEGLHECPSPLSPGQPAHQREPGVRPGASGALASGWYGAMTLPEEQVGMEYFPSSELATQGAEQQPAKPPSSPPTPRPAPAHGRGEAPLGAPGPGAARQGRHRADARRPPYCRRAGDLPVGVRPAMFRFPSSRTRPLPAAKAPGRQRMPRVG